MFKYSLLNWIARLYNFFIKTGNNLQSLFIFYMRATWGYQFFILGLAKLGSIDHVAQMFSSLAIPAPTLTAHLVAILEALCGFLLFIGLGARIAAVPLIIIMLIALATAHGTNLSGMKFLFEPQSLVKEAPYPFLLTSLIVFIFGPGEISIDAWIKRWAENQPKY